MAKQTRSKRKKHINASELGTFLYCRRAWWYTNQGEPSANQAAMAHGTQMHEQHGRQVMHTSCLQTIAVFFVLAAAILLLLLFLQRIIA